MERMRTSYPGRWLVILGFAATVLSVLYVVACLAAPSLSGDVSCELTPGSSVFGEATRSWLPPGRTCTYDLTEYGRYVSSPSPLRLVVVAAAIVGLPATAYLSRLLRRASLVNA